MSQQTPSEANTLPPLYRQVVVLDRVAHADLCLKPDTDLRFAAKVNAIILTFGEIAVAAQHFPILFTPGEHPLAVALVGLRPNQNLYVGEDGQWRRGAYLPAYLRRYPFILFAPQLNDERRLLALDPTADHLGETGQALFEGGEPTPLTQEAAQLCHAFDEQFGQARAFAAALKEKDLLVENQASVTLETGERIELGGFLAIDAARFAALDGETVLDWRSRGWLDACYAQLFSAGRWANLIELAAKTGGNRE